MLIRRVIATSVLAMLVTVAFATPAMAHAELTGSNPAKGASLDAAPTQLQLTFNEPVSPIEITVTGPQGFQWTVGQVSVAGPVVTAPVQAIGPAGPYAITYKVKSEDGDDVTGTVEFTMTVASTPGPTTTTGTATSAPATTATTATTSASAGQSATSEDGGGIPAVVWILVAVAVLLAAAVLALRVRGRSAAPPDGPEDSEAPTER